MKNCNTHLLRDASYLHYKWKVKKNPLEIRFTKCMEFFFKIRINFISSKSFTLQCGRNYRLHFKSNKKKEFLFFLNFINKIWWESVSSKWNSSISKWKFLQNAFRLPPRLCLLFELHWKMISWDDERAKYLVILYCSSKPTYNQSIFNGPRLSPLWPVYMMRSLLFSALWNYDMTNVAFYKVPYKF